MLSKNFDRWMHRPLLRGFNARRMMAKVSKRRLSDRWHCWRSETTFDGLRTVLP